uniref:uncharacterized protein isoform X2 n=1 Tax=Myxine glutinosa TaxID=7769 RepID=UPI00358F7EB6
MNFVPFICPTNGSSGGVARGVIQGVQTSFVKSLYTLPIGGLRPACAMCHHHAGTMRGRFLPALPVIDSQSTNETTFYPWLIVEREGTVVTTHCDCAQGMDESCSHIGTLMFALEAAVRLCGKRTALQDPSYRKFPKTRAGISYTPLQKINFTSPKAMKKSKEQQNDPALLARIPKPKEKKVIPAPSTEEINTFYKAIAPVRPAILSLHPEYSDLYIPKSLSVNCENEDK